MTAARSRCSMPARKGSSTRATCCWRPACRSSRLELLIDDLVPRRGTRVVWCDDGDGSALRAARRMSRLGYTDVAVLDGGIAAWEAAGYRLYSGVHVPSKAFAEVVEHEAGTPWISAPDLKALIDSGADIAIFDSRSYEEYHNNSIPTAISVPGAELVYRFTDMVPSPDTTVIVNCGGRTRSIIGAQALRNAGFRNKIMSLKDGTMAWHLAGFEVVHGATRRPPEVSETGRRAAIDAAARVAERCGIPRIDKATLAAWRAEADRRTLYVLDVRTPEEYRAGHLAGARSAPGGQLVQETDAHIATWNARVVLVDDNGVRATMTASWLKQMGWNDVAVLVADPSAGDWESGPHVPRVLGLEGAAVASIEPAALRDQLAAGNAVVIDLDTSRRYAQGHIPGAWFAIRSRLAKDLGKLPKAETIVLTSPDGALARLAAAELAGSDKRTGHGSGRRHAGVDRGRSAARNGSEPYGERTRRRRALGARTRPGARGSDARVPRLGDRPRQPDGDRRRPAVSGRHRLTARSGSC